MGRATHVMGRGEKGKLVPGIPIARDPLRVCFLLIEWKTKRSSLQADDGSSLGLESGRIDNVLAFSSDISPVYTKAPSARCRAFNAPSTQIRGGARTSSHVLNF
jgi:hypothetical protein